jgi:glycerophosphoryl diester phosphodiesterase
MRELDVGSWFSPEFAGERVPSLEEVLVAVGERAKTMIELKYYGQEQDLARRVAAIVTEQGAEERIAIMSLKYDGVAEIQALQPTWTAGLLSAQAFGDLSVLDLDYLAVNTSMISAGFVEKAHQKKKKVLVWTVNDALTMFKMISLGVDGIITDEPALAREVLLARKEMSSVERLLLQTAVILNRPVSGQNYRDQSP